jgi:hypothetical protein
MRSLEIPIVGDVSMDGWTRGRPDTARLAIDAARAFDAEAVFYVSNPAGTRTVVHTCLAEGIPTFGATWDS